MTHSDAALLTEAALLLHACSRHHLEYDLEPTRAGIAATRLDAMAAQERAPEPVGERSDLEGLIAQANIEYAHDCNTRGWAEVGRHLSQYQADAILGAGYTRTFAPPATP